MRVGGSNSNNFVNSEVAFDEPNDDEFDSFENQIEEEAKQGNSVRHSGGLRGPSNISQNVGRINRSSDANNVYRFQARGGGGNSREMNNFVVRMPGSQANHPSESGSRSN